MVRLFESILFWNTCKKNYSIYEQNIIEKRNTHSIKACDQGDRNPSLVIHVLLQETIFVQIFITAKAT